MLAPKPRFPKLSLPAPGNSSNMPQEDENQEKKEQERAKPETETKSIKKKSSGSKNIKNKDSSTLPKKKKKKKKRKDGNSPVKNKKKAKGKPRSKSRVSPTNEIYKLGPRDKAKSKVDDRLLQNEDGSLDYQITKGAVKEEKRNDDVSLVDVNVDQYCEEVEKESRNKLKFGDNAQLLEEGTDLPEGNESQLAILEAKDAFTNVNIEVKDQVDLEAQFFNEVIDEAGSVVRQILNESEADETEEKRMHEENEESRAYLKKEIVEIAQGKRRKNFPMNRPDFERDRPENGTNQPKLSSSKNTNAAKLEGIKTQSILELKQRITPGAFRINGASSADETMKFEDDEDSALILAAIDMTENTDNSILEEKVRQRLLEDTARASVVLVEHGGNSNRYEDPIADFQRRAQLEQFKPHGLKEKMFGDSKSVASLDIGSSPDDFIRKRDHLPWTVKLNATTNLWVASIQTNQKAWEASQYMYEKSSLELKRSIISFAGSTEQEAYEIGVAMAPPLMQDIEENPFCFLCKSKFALLRRPCNCRNCGVVICTSCTCNWTAKQIPSTYNIEKRSTVPVCLACDWLASSFQEALLLGDWDKVYSLYESGNINLRSIYDNRRKKLLGDEALYPIHMAILGGNLELVKWLLFNHYCPLYKESTSLKRSRNKLPLLLTSRGRSPIDVALEQPRPEILKFLVSNRGLSLLDSRKENADTLKHLMCLLKIIPESMLKNVTNNSDQSLNEAVLSVETLVDEDAPEPTIGQFATF